MPTGKITIVKQFTYRGDPTEQWSNSYWFQGAPPATPDDWMNFTTEVAALERPLFHPGISIVHYLGYADGSPHHAAVWSAPDSVVGDYTPAGNIGPGDAASTVRWSTEDLTSKGKRIYMRKYFHGVDLAGGVTAEDSLMSEYVTALSAYAAAISASAATALSNGFAMADVHGDPVLHDQWAVLPVVTTRTLKRRGKRP